MRCQEVYRGHIGLRVNELILATGPVGGKMKIKSNPDRYPAPDFVTGTQRTASAGVACAEPAQQHPAVIDVDFADLPAPMLRWDGRTLRFRLPPR